MNKTNPTTDHKKNSGISVLVLSFETSSYDLRHSLESIVRQTLAPKEILLFDLNEPHSSHSRSLREDAEQFPEIQVLDCPEHKLAEQRNYAISKASGKYYCFCSGTEIWEPDKLRRTYSAFMDSPLSSAVICNGERITPDGTHVYASIPGNEVEDILFSGCYDEPSAILYSAEALQEIGQFDPDVSVYTDLDLLVRIRRDGFLELVDEKLFSVQTNPLPSDKQFQGYRELFYRQYDLVAANRKLAFMYHLQLMHLAAQSAMWVEMVVHAILALLTRPIKSLVHCEHALVRALNGMHRHLILKNRVRLHSLKLRRTVLRYRGLNSFKKSDKLKPLREVELDELEPTPIDLPGRREPYSYAFQKKYKNVHLCNTSIIREGSFAFCKELTRIVIPAHVHTIEAHAFHGCRNLKTVVIENGSLLSKIEAYAFAECSSLTTILLPSTLGEIEAYAFAGCTNLKEISFQYYQKGDYVARPEFPAMISQIPHAAFAGCEELQQILLTNQNSSFRIEADAFSHCYSLERFSLNGKLKYIGDYAFAHCLNLTETAIPYMDAASYLGRGAFLQCQKLKFIQIPHALSIIQKYTYYGCASLKHVKIPTTIQMINTYAFRACTDLLTVDLKRSSTKYLPSSFDPTVVFKNQTESTDS